MSEAHRLYPAIPLSPPSPPADGVKEGSKSHFADYAPQSPASPFMSIAIKSYGQSFAESQASSVSAAAQRSPSPPASTPMSTQTSQQPNMKVATSFPNTENSIIGHARKAPAEFDEEHITKRQRIDNEATTRQEEGGHELKAATSAPWQKADESQASGQRFAKAGVLSIVGTQSQKVAEETAQPAPVEMSLEQLQRNVGEVFHLCKLGKMPLLLCH